jgi:hypothetical protein
MLLLTMLSSRCPTDAVQEDYLRRWGQTHVGLKGRNRRIVISGNFYWVGKLYRLFYARIGFSLVQVAD